MAQRTHYRLNPKRSAGLWLLVIIFMIFGAYHYVAPLPYRAIVWKEARAHSVSPYLVAAVIRVESSYRPDAVSAKGAVGLMQLMPATAQWASQKADKRSIKTQDLNNPALNIHLGTWYLSQLLGNFYGNPVLGLAAYNAGGRNVARWIAEGRLQPTSTTSDQIPFPETKNFVTRVLFYEKVYHFLYGAFPAMQPPLSRDLAEGLKVWHQIMGRE
ncbi:lytic transglycosylase domain-containing protein [Sulfobacillus sp. hq2]|uniref:Transglycosylase SLT domain-containing protein n=1 Tax=Sulfobacillus thermotolerans TaxID=338644 RepID=A0ABM6RPL8_9FIRM|nr:lytic transglycosylase domain-containing protein [Sulfobacillus sp. hq2]AUW93294.1 hypothetical protein BXT84_04440 [Sulfobacillus thermotolerans]MCY0907368.1 lytic transglycosylase domain-containing protein [Sulfobacillus thermotolerans]POB11626.1 lytic transglycosylase [Sulfobacillus sp. hq2]